MNIIYQLDIYVYICMCLCAHTVYVVQYIAMQCNAEISLRVSIPMHICQRFIEATV